MADSSRGRKPGRLRRKISALVIGVLVALLFAEVTLRIYNPFRSVVRADDIVLPIYQTVVRANPDDRRISGVARRQYNSLGFRGPEPPTDFAKSTTVLTVGGSTTACF